MKRNSWQWEIKAEAYKMFLIYRLKSQRQQQNLHVWHFGLQSCHWRELLNCLFFEKLNQINAKSPQVDDWMSQVDSNQDGKLSYDEFKKSLDGKIAVNE